MLDLWHHIGDVVLVVVVVAALVATILDFIKKRERP